MSDTNHVYTDSKGGKVTVTESQVTFEDASIIFTTYPGRSGFDATVTREQAGNPVDFQRSANVNGTLSGGNVRCEGRSAPLLYGVIPSLGWRDSVSATERVVDAVTRREIEDFLAAHPTIKASMLADDSLARARDINSGRDYSTASELTIMNGKPSSLSELGQFPSQFKACPNTDVTKIVEGPTPR